MVNFYEFRCEGHGLYPLWFGVDDEDDDYISAGSGITPVHDIMEHNITDNASIHDEFKALGAIGLVRASTGVIDQYYGTISSDVAYLLEQCIINGHEWPEVSFKDKLHLPNEFYWLEEQIEEALSRGFRIGIEECLRDSENKKEDLAYLTCAKSYFMCRNLMVLGFKESMVRYKKLGYDNLGEIFLNLQKTLSRIANEFNDDQILKVKFNDNTGKFACWLDGVRL